eukprot:g10204.t1
MPEQSAVMAAGKAPETAPQSGGQNLQHKESIEEVELHLDIRKMEIDSDVQRLQGQLRIQKEHLDDWEEFLRERKGDDAFREAYEEAVKQYEALARKMNAINLEMFEELGSLFRSISGDQSVGAVLLLGGDESKGFCSGIDLQVLTSLQPTHIKDPGRKAIVLTEGVRKMQEAFTAVQRCSKPVIGVAYKVCIGAGLELLSACDIRFCTKDCVLSIREPRMGLAADLGALQRMPRQCTGNTSLLNLLVYTARDFDGHLADAQLGFSQSCGIGNDERRKLEEIAFSVAREIAKLSPVAVLGTKKTMLFSSESTQAEGLEYVRTLNGGLLQTEDLKKAVEASMMKTEPKFSKL